MYGHMNLIYTPWPIYSKRKVPEPTEQEKWVVCREGVNISE